MTYHFVLAMFPMLIFLLTLLPLFNLDQSQITGLLSNAPADTSSLIKGVISDVTKNSSGGLLSIGLILAIWSASNGMTAIMNSFNVAYDVEDNRNGILLKDTKCYFHNCVRRRIFSCDGITYYGVSYCSFLIRSSWIG